ncbi:hypothetical protein BT96DRAFT_813323 [Gymnopus androsaceus JB14]|uniref:Large ribosomal subunit protein mL59 domain-containing protein n=1 Tax=Gymnopus androsaceus JB14 TaxID=1447944 RepID=A0A6A4I773_9AGAR|nr:hypothetical protein BT96DRAFT_813323 [Gymnopus androsaceus JB14]
MTAVQALKKFRLHELKGLQSHIARHGPLPAPSTSSSGIQLPNPFLPHRNPRTGRWTPPKYSLRRQAELINKAKASNNLGLLPPGPKLSSLAADTLSEKLDASVGTSQKLAVLDEALAFPVDWVGKFEPKVAPGSELGIPLYAAKKRMFKGHKWERTRDRREAHRSMLMRDMDTRIRRYKKQHQKKKPNPLKPSRNTSTKLPF